MDLMEDDDDIGNVILLDHYDEWALRILIFLYE